MAFYIDAEKNGSSGEIAYLLKKCILHCPKKWTEIVFLCIGSDRVTGDCLGPYIGHLLHPHETGHIFVYGTLSCPVHALNLEKTSSLITRLHPHALVIAIDASLGQKKTPGLCDHWKWCTLPRCWCSERSSTCRGHPYHRHCKYCRNHGAAYPADYPALHRGSTCRCDRLRDP